jgi:hypothetical protein
MIDNVLFEFRKGDTYSRDFTITDYELPISKVFFTVKNNSSDKRYVLQKSLIINGEIIESNGITLVSDEDNVKTYNILIKATDTDDMKVDYDYFFDVEIVSPGVGTDEIKQTLMVGTLRLKEVATQTVNEV